MRSLIRRRLTRERVLVTTFADEAFEGVLLEADRRHLVLADASQLTPDGERTRVDGKLWLPTENIAYLQHPGTGA